MSYSPVTSSNNFADTISSIFSLNCLSIAVSPTIISSKNKLPVVFLRIKSTVPGFFNSFPFIKDFGRAFFDSENLMCSFHPLLPANTLPDFSESLLLLEHPISLVSSYPAKPVFFFLLYLLPTSHCVLLLQIKVHFRKRSIITFAEKCLSIYL